VELEPSLLLVVALDVAVVRDVLLSVEEDEEEGVPYGFRCSLTGLKLLLAVRLPELIGSVLTSTAAAAAAPSATAADGAPASPPPPPSSPPPAANGSGAAADKSEPLLAALKRFFFRRLNS